MTRKRWFRVIALACFLILLGAAGAWYFLDRMVSAAMHVERHAAGTYYFNGFRGGVLGPFQPLDEISRDEAMARDRYVVGVFSEDGRLAAIERYMGGSLFFRYEYSYDAEGRVEERGLHGGSVVVRRFPWSSK